MERVSFRKTCTKRLCAAALALALCFALLPAAGADDIDDLINYLEIYYREQGLGDTMRITRVGRLLIFDAWAAGVGASVDSFKSVPALVDVWNQLTGVYVEICDQLQTSLDEEYPEYGTVVIFNVLDDRDESTLLVSIGEGKILYDGALKSLGV